MLAGVVPVLWVAGAMVAFPANPEWRLLGGLTAVSAVWLTLLCLWKTGGWNWLRAFAFPVAFFLIAVPWPRAFEARVMRNLMNFNASAALEMVRLAGYEAYRRGNLIELPTGLLGVEEACSGIRSLQGTLMAALFFGEMFRLRTGRRLALAGAGLAVALAGNVIRTSFLTVTASRHGIPAVEAWHDRAGLMTLLVSTALIWLAAELLSRGRGGARARTDAPVSPGRKRRSLSLVFPAGALVFWLLTFAGTEWWYARHDAEQASLPAWRIREPEALPDARRVEIPDATARMLRYDEGVSGRWTDEDGLRWQYFFFIWSEGNAAQVAALHDPRACLGAIGMKLEEQYPAQPMAVEGVPLGFRAFRFRDRGLPVHVFQAVTNNRGLSEEQAAIGPQLEHRNRWLAVKSGRRFRGRRIVEVAVWGTESLAEARAGLQRFLDRGMLLTPGEAGPR